MADVFKDIAEEIDELYSAHICEDCGSECFSGKLQDKVREIIENELDKRSKDDCSCSVEPEHEKRIMSLEAKLENTNRLLLGVCDYRLVCIERNVGKHEQQLGKLETERISMLETTVENLCKGDVQQDEYIQQNIALIDELLKKASLPSRTSRPGL